MRTNTWVALVVVLLAQTGVLGWMVWDRARLLRSGKEIVLKTEPVDPRSLFRGDYVILSYPIANHMAALSDSIAVGDRRCAVLEEKLPGEWSVATLTSTPPPALTSGQVMLAGTVASVWNDGVNQRVQLKFGIESYFVPEGEGKVLEDKVRTGDLRVILAVDASGKAAIKGLVLDGNVRYDEPMF